MSAHVLIVESEPWLSDHFQQVLTKEAFTVTAVSNAYVAIDAINERQPDVIVLSLMLSGTDGIALLHELQSYVDTAAIPVVVCSERAAELSRDDLEPYGVRRLIDTSTMHPQDLPNVVRSVLS